jgi:hypothetical protein
VSSEAARTSIKETTVLINTGNANLCAVRQQSIFLKKEEN